MALAIGFAAITLGGFALLAVGILGMFQRLRPNHIAGIRTPYTCSSEQAWYDTHRFAGPILALGGAAVLATGLAFLPFAAASALPGAFGFTVLAVSASAALAVTVVGLRYGTAHARAAGRR